MNKESFRQYIKNSPYDVIDETVDGIKDEFTLKNFYEDEDTKKIFEDATTYAWPEYVKYIYYFKDSRENYIQASILTNKYINYCFDRTNSLCLWLIGEAQFRTFIKMHQNVDIDFIQKHFFTKIYAYTETTVLCFFNKENKMMSSLDGFLSKRDIVRTRVDETPLSTKRWKTFRDILPFCQSSFKYSPKLGERIYSDDTIYSNICLHGKNSLCHDTFCLEHHGSEWSNVFCMSCRSKHQTTCPYKKIDSKNIIDISSL